MPGMKQSKLIFIQALVLLSACSRDGEETPAPARPTQMTNIHFEEFSTDEQARAALLKAFPRGTPADQVRTSMTAIGAKCYEIRNNVLSCRYMEPYSRMVYKVWSIAVDLDSDGHVISIRLTSGLTGP